MLKNVVNVTDQMDSIPLEADTTYTVNNTTLTHIVFGLPNNPKIGDKYEIVGQTGDQVYSCSWQLSIGKKAKIIFDDITAEDIIIAGREDGLSMECISTEPLTFRVISSVRGENFTIDGEMNVKK